MKTERSKERPIIFGAPMVRAILTGRKTMTRRLVQSPHVADLDVFSFDAERGEWEGGIYGDGGNAAHGEWLRCPYGVPGAKLWVKESFALVDGVTFHDGPPSTAPESFEPKYRADETECAQPRWFSSRFMPRWASRLTLEVVAVRVEQLQAISGKDILAEGAVVRSHDDPNFGRSPISAFDGKLYVDLRSLWAAGWDSINGKKAAWRTNPWCWVVSFRTA